MNISTDGCVVTLDFVIAGDGKVTIRESVSPTAEETTEEGHGFGAQSIRYITEKLKGNCQFVVEGKYFVLRIVL